MIKQKTDKLMVTNTKPDGKKVLVRLISYSSDELKGLRKEFGVKQKEIAELLNITQSYVSHLESGLASPNIEQMAALSAFFSNKAGYKIVFFVDHDWKNGPSAKEYWGHKA